MRFLSRRASADIGNIADEDASQTAPETSSLLDIAPPYALRDTAGRTAVLDELTGLVIGFDRPAHIWHGAVPSDVNLPGRSAAARLVRELSTQARPVATLLTAADARPPADPDVVAEYGTHLVLAD